MPEITISLSEDIVRAVRLPPDEIEEELRKELAVSLYARQALSFGKSRKLAKMTIWQFQRLLAKRKVAPHYDDMELGEDIAYAANSNI